MNRSKAVGTWTEARTLDYVKCNGFPEANRRVLHGSKDFGDILMCPGFILSVKGGGSAEALQYADLEKWIIALREQCFHAGGDHGLFFRGMLVTKRRGYGAQRAGFWWTHFISSEWIYGDASPIVTNAQGSNITWVHNWPVVTEESKDIGNIVMTTTLDPALRLARFRGLGDPL